MTSTIITFKNSLRLVYIHHPGVISHCGLMIEAGCRDEPVKKPGLAHFLEHVLFKGTHKRNAWHILNRMEVVGGELNAYTTKEETCIHASMLNEHFSRAAELISDIVFNSTFPENEIQKEKEVVIDEIRSCQDNPAEQLFDDFECIVFRDHPLGRPILGDESSVRSLTRTDLVKFVKSKYRHPEMVFSYIGSLPLEVVKEIIGEFFNHRSGKLSADIKTMNRIKTPRRETRNKSVSHSHFICGSKAYSLHTSKRTPLYLLNNILGGPGLNARLNMNLREKYGLTYHVESGFAPFRDTGLFHVYMAADKKLLDRCTGLMEKEFKKLKTEKISPAQLTRYKYQLKGQLAIAQENRAGVMLNNAKSVLNYNQPMNMSTVFKQIDAITSTQLLEVANEILDMGKMSSLTYEPLQ